ncbi:small acid-soluble spore protein E (minor gamma-type SASP) [Neobacillus niacini]|uniref:gamma-type small acid-soluble spore protein n=1 Tax=Neobacillus niacini TaxID=86668 RepID=UPI0027827873|nr:gamma-type small acid-soluble spore protein [Neobacillus niacini]MDQ1005013.1 small acid-soluble spore protein E (minor gamma-type SASP) [Neobacillus niacini]
MANNFNQQPNKTSAGTNIQEVRQQNAQSQGQGSAGQFGTEFASQTDAAEVRRQNQQSQSGQGSAGATGSAGQFGTEFASQTDAAEVRRQNQQSQANKGQGNSGQFGQS